MTNQGQGLIKLKEEEDPSLLVLAQITDSPGCSPVGGGHRHHAMQAKILSKGTCQPHQGLGQKEFTLPIFHP